MTTATSTDERGGSSRWHPLRWLGAGAAGVLLAAACGGGDDAGGAGAGPTGDPVAGGSLVAYPGAIEPLSWDPVAVNGTSTPSADAAFFTPVFGMLVYEDHDGGDVVGGMAESITPTDPSHWVLRLREGVTFSDGTPYDAEAVEFNWERIAASETSPNAAAAQTIESLSVVDPLTLEITLTEPNGSFDRLVAQSLPFVGSPAALRADPTGFAQGRPVGAGPFLLREHREGDRAVFERNPDYWDQPRPYLDELTLVALGEHQSYAGFRNGEAQYMRVTDEPTVLAEARQAGTRVIELGGAQGGGQAYLLNRARPPFDDPLARRALQRALDVETAAATLYPDYGETAGGLFTETSPYFDPDQRFPSYDPEAAQDLIDEYVAETGEPLRFAFASPPADPATAFFQAQLSELDGLDVSLSEIEPDAYFPQLLAGEFDAAIFPVDVTDPALSLADYFGTGGVFNVTGYSNPALDDLLQRGRAALDEAERVEIYRQVQEILIEDIPAVIFHRPFEFHLAADAVGGLRYHLTGTVLWDGVWLDPAAA